MTDSLRHALDALGAPWRLEDDMIVDRENTVVVSDVSKKGEKNLWVMAAVNAAANGVNSASDLALWNDDIGLPWSVFPDGPDVPGWKVKNAKGAVILDAGKLFEKGGDQSYAGKIVAAVVQAMNGGIRDGGMLENAAKMVMAVNPLESKLQDVTDKALAIERDRQRAITALSSSQKDLNDTRLMLAKLLLFIDHHIDAGTYVGADFLLQFAADIEGDLSLHDEMETLSAMGGYIDDSTRSRSYRFTQAENGAVNFIESLNDPGDENDSKLLTEAQLADIQEHIRSGAGMPELPPIEVYEQENGHSIDLNQARQEADRREWEEAGDRMLDPLQRHAIHGFPSAEEIDEKFKAFDRHFDRRVDGLAERIDLLESRTVVRIDGSIFESIVGTVIDRTDRQRVGAIQAPPAYLPAEIGRHRLAALLDALANAQGHSATSIQHDIAQIARKVAAGEPF